MRTASDCGFRARVAGLRKAYGRIEAVRGVSFELLGGETLGLLGPNGAGKTTLMQMIIGLLRPDEGRVELDDGTTPTDTRARARIGIAPQSLAFYPELTMAENLALFGTLYKLSGRALREAVGEALERTGLDALAQRRAGTCSGGQQRRLNVACALVHRPDLLILDEPTVGVDPHSRQRIFEAVEELTRSGVAVLYSTHYIEEAERLCDRVAVIDQGRIVAIGSLEDLIRRYGGPPRLEAPVRDLRLRGPDLQAAFMSLIGRPLRDAGVAP